MPIHHVNAADVENFDTLGVSGLSNSSSHHSNLSSLSKSYPRPKETDLSGSFRNDLYDLRLAEGHHNNSITSSGGSSHSTHSASLNLGRNAGNLAKFRTLGGGSFRGLPESYDSSISDGRQSFASAGSSSHSGVNYGRSSHYKEPIYENAEGFMESYLSGVDYDKNGQGQGFIPEEDETESLSTMEDSFSVTNQQQQYQLSQSYTSRPSFQQHHPNSQHQNHRQSNRHRQSRIRSDGDNSSVASFSQCQGQDSVYSAQLESRVTNLSLELATTKAALDELQLEHRRVKNEKEELKSKISELQEANESLHRMIDKLEKEKILMNMEKTVGVGRSVDGLRSSFLSVAVNKNDDVFKVSTFRAEPRGSVKKKSSRRNRSRSGHEQSFRSSINSEADNISVASIDAASVISCLSHEDFEELAKSVQDGMLPSKKSSNALDKVPKKNSSEALDKLAKKTSSKSLLAEETYDESDPFATWSAPEDRAKQENKQKNWFQRRVEALNQNQQKDDGDDDSDELSGDPFDTCSKGDHIDQIFDDKSERSRSEQRGVGFQWFRGNRGQK